MHAKLNIQAKSDSTLSLQVSDQLLIPKNEYVYKTRLKISFAFQVIEAEYAEIHRNLSSGWDTYIPDELLNYIKLPLHNGPFELYVDDGIVNITVKP